MQELELKAAADKFVEEVQHRRQLDCIFEKGGEQSVTLGKGLGFAESSMVFEAVVGGMKGVFKLGYPAKYMEAMQDLHIAVHDQVILFPT